MTKVHNLEANSMEILLSEEGPQIETEDGEMIVYNVNARFVRTVRDVPNKRLKEKKK
jgi:hypothetical protein